jgi:hypothetical protein
LPLHLEHLRHEVDREALAAGVARRAAIDLAAHRLAVASGRTEEREPAVALLHLVAELDLETLAANAAALDHSGHGTSPA